MAAHDLAAASRAGRRRPACFPAARAVRRRSRGRPLEGGCGPGPEDEDRCALLAAEPFELDCSVAGAQPDARGASPAFRIVLSEGGEEAVDEPVCEPCRVAAVGGKATGIARHAVCHRQSEPEAAREPGGDASTAAVEVIGYGPQETIADEERRLRLSNAGAAPAGEGMAPL